MKKLVALFSILAIVVAGHLCRANDIEVQPSEHVEEKVREPKTPAREKAAFKKAYKKVLSTMLDDPPVQVLINAALSQAKVEYARGQSWARKSRTAHLLPEIKVSAGYDTDRDESLDRYQDRPDRWGADTDRDFGFKITATWKLSRLVFTSDELSVQKALEDISDKREQIIGDITSHYFLRRQLIILQGIAPDDDPAETVERMRKIEESEAIIDALTGGALSRNLGK